MKTREEKAATRGETEHHSPAPYVFTFVVLLVLTVVTFLASGVDLGAAQIPVALGIAATKGGFVAYYFMHLREQRGVNAMFLIVAVVFIVILIGGMAADVRTRHIDVEPPSAPGP
jgi:cytochrome c oxidase subunit 4